MADLKDTQLVVAVPALGDIITFVDIDEPLPLKNKQCTFSGFLVAFRIKQGETILPTAVSAGVTRSFLFSQPLGTATDGSDYDIGDMFCMNSLEGDTKVGFAISNRTENGLEITPVEDAIISFTAIIL